MTPACVALKEAGIDHRVVQYDHDPTCDSFGEEAVASTGVDASTVFKTLLAKLPDGEMVVAVIPVGCHRTFVDESAASHDEIYVSGGRLGLEVVVGPDAFVQLLGAQFSGLSV